MKKKKFLSLLGVVFVLGLIVGCGYTNQEKEYMKQLEKQASENAINYIKDKYGFTASIVSTEVEKEEPSPIPDLTPDPTGYIFVNLKYNNKTFEVYISGEEETNDGIDNYQYEEIVNGILNLIEAKTNIRPYNNYIYFGRISKHNGLIKQLYDNNLQDIIKNNYFDIGLEYINESNLEYISTNNLLNDFNKSKIILVNYNSLESYKKGLSVDEYILGSFLESSLIKNAINIESAYIVDNGKTHYYKFDLQKLGDIYYYNDSDVNNDVYLSYTTVSSVSNWIGYGAFKNVKQISDAYLVRGNYSNLYVYIPINKINRYDVKDIDVGIECYGKFRTEHGEVVGDYFVSKLYLNSCDKNYDIKFTLLHSTYEK